MHKEEKAEDEGKQETNLEQTDEEEAETKEKQIVLDWVSGSPGPYWLTST